MKLFASPTFPQLPIFLPDEKDIPPRLCILLHFSLSIPISDFHTHWPLATSSFQNNTIIYSQKSNIKFRTNMTLKLNVTHCSLSQALGQSPYYEMHFLLIRTSSSVQVCEPAELKKWPLIPNIENYIAISLWIIITSDKSILPLESRY